MADGALDAGRRPCCLSLAGAMARPLQLLIAFGMTFYALSHMNKVFDRMWETCAPQRLTCAAYSLRLLHAHAEDASSGASSASVRRPSSCASVCCASLRPAKAALANTKAPASSRSRRAADRCCDVLCLQSSSSSLSCSASTAMRDDIERRMRTFAAPALLSEPLPSASHTQPPPTM